MATEHYAPCRWVLAATAALGLWLITNPFFSGYTTRALLWSDVVSGTVVIVLSLLALKPDRGVVCWSISLIGIWVMFAPLAFWAREPAGYANGTLVGALLVTFAFVIPMGMKMAGPAIPEGWSYNPSAWPQRVPIIALSFVGFLAARYMAGYQLGHIDTAWDPFFGDGTEKVLDSEVSRSWPVSDAGLGAITYMIETLMGCMGDNRRWRTMPWMVAAFGIAVVPLGVVSLVLVMLQPVAVGEWCSLCLFTAMAMLVMIPLSLDEVVATVQFLVDQKRRGRSAWRVFWMGGDLPDDTPVRQPVRPETWDFREMIAGVTGTWYLWTSALAGIWVMAAPDVLAIGRRTPAADSNHIVGALVVTFAVTALGEVGRPIRFINLLLGGWLVVAPWMLDGGTLAFRFTTALAGLIIMGLCLPLGSVRDRYGWMDRLVAWNPLARRGSYGTTQARQS